MQATIYLLTHTCSCGALASRGFFAGCRPGPCTARRFAPVAAAGRHLQ